MGDDLGIHDLDIWELGVPYGEFARLRRDAPVFWTTTTDNNLDGGYWSLTRHADVVTVSKDPEGFSAWQWGNLLENPSEDELPLRRAMMLNMDPPEHNFYRRLVLDTFTPRMVAGLEGRIRDLTAELFGGLEGRSEFDFVHDIAGHLPVTVMCELMGIPASDRKLIADWNAQLIGFDDPELETSAEGALGAATEMFAYGMELARDRVGGDGTDLVTVLSNATVDGEALDEIQFNGLFVQLIVAGSETTQTLLSGAVKALIEHPEQAEILRDDPELIPNGVDEMLRYVTPLHYFRRTATRDLDLHGQTIRAGDAVVMWYVSANRDEAVFDAPDAFDVRRPNADRHLAFGHGTHFCLGSHLARLEARVFLEEFFEHFDSAEQIAPARRLRSNLVNGLKELPVHLDRR